MKAFLVATMIAAFMAGANAQSSPACDSVVTKVSLEDTTGLTAARQSSLRKLLIGRCFQREDGEVLSGAVYHELRTWGYMQPTVYEPVNIVVLDDGVHPSPVAVTIDFRLTGLDQSAK